MTYEYNGIEININFEKEESEKHIENDFQVLVNTGIDNIIKEKFIPWLLGEDFIDKDKEKVFEGIKVYDITYQYGRVIAKYSPTGEDNFFGQFELSFEAGNDYTTDMLEAVACGILVKDGKVYKGMNYDI